MKPIRPFAAAFLLAPLALAPGCAVAAGAVGGYMIHRDIVGEEGHVAHVTYDYVEVWETALEVLRDRSDQEVVAELGRPRLAKGGWNKVRVEVEVEAYDFDRTVIRVRAEQANFSIDGPADEVMTEIVDRLRDANPID